MSQIQRQESDSLIENSISLPPSLPYLIISFYFSLLFGLKITVDWAEIMELLNNWEKIRFLRLFLVIAALVSFPGHFLRFPARPTIFFDIFIYILKYKRV